MAKNPKSPDPADRTAQKKPQDRSTRNSAGEAQPKFRRRAAARPDEVLDAALELFAENGFAATRVEDIAKRAGISKGAVYLYFPSKQTIIEGLVARAISPITADAINMVKDYEGDPRTLITLIMSMLAQRLKDPKLLAIPKLIMREAVSFPEIAALYRERVLNVFLPVFINLISRGVADGYFRKVDPELTLRSVMGPILTHLLLSEIFGVTPKDGLAMDELINNHISILFDGLSNPDRDEQ